MKDFLNKKNPITYILLISICSLIFLYTFIIEGIKRAARETKEYFIFGIRGLK